MATAKQQLAAELFCHTGTAIRELAGDYYPGISYYRGIKQDSVRQFQQKWNTFSVLAAGDPAYAGTPGKLVVDGMYGPNTARCMDVFVSAAFTYLGTKAPTYADPREGGLRILPRRAADVAAWAQQWRSIVGQICETDAPPVPQPNVPGKPAPANPATPAPGQPQPTINLVELAKHIRNSCANGYHNVFKNPSGKTVYVSDKLTPELRRVAGWTFVRVQKPCQGAAPFVPQEDNTMLLAGLGLAAAGAGAFVWWRRRKKKKKGR